MPRLLRVAQTGGWLPGSMDMPPSPGSRGLLRLLHLADCAVLAMLLRCLGRFWTPVNAKTREYQDGHPPTGDRKKSTPPVALVRRQVSQKAYISTAGAPEPRSPGHVDSKGGYLPPCPLAWAPPLVKLSYRLLAARRREIRSLGPLLTTQAPSAPCSAASQLVRRVRGKRDPGAHAALRRVPVSQLSALCHTNAELHAADWRAWAYGMTCAVCMSRRSSRWSSSRNISAIAG